MTDPLAERIARIDGKMLSDDVATVYHAMANTFRAFLAERVTEEQIAKVAFLVLYRREMPRSTQEDAERRWEMAYRAVRAKQTARSIATDLLTLLRREVGG